jgi:hypothetical protein
MTGAQGKRQWREPGRDRECGARLVVMLAGAVLRAVLRGWHSTCYDILVCCQGSLTSPYGSVRPYDILTIKQAAP